MWNERNFTIEDRRLLGTWNGRLIFAREGGRETVEDSEGTVYRLPDHGKVLHMAGVWRSKMILNTTYGVLALEDTITGADTDRMIEIRGPDFCNAVCGDRIVSFDHSTIEIWKTNDPYSAKPLRVRFLKVAHFASAGVPTCALELNDSIVIGTSSGFMEEYSHDGELMERMDLHGTRSYVEVKSIVEWEGCVLSGHGSTVDIWCKDKIRNAGWRRLQCISMGGCLTVWNGKLISRNYYGGIYSVWSIRTWNRDIHRRYSKEIRSTIFASVMCLYRSKVDRDVILLIVPRIVRMFPFSSMRRRITRGRRTVESIDDS